MASFKVLKEFSVGVNTPTKHLHPGGIYMVGHNVTGLTAAEAAELLKLAPAGTFEPIDAEADTVADYIIRVGGNVGASGETEIK